MTVDLRDKYEVVIGLEIHAQLKTRSKIFCGCPTQFGDEPNSNTCPVCLGLPGALPVLNREVVNKAARAALALNCSVNPISLFARKNYFYPDLPKGYQISQYDRPFSEHGEAVIDSAERDELGHPHDWRKKRFRITRLHLEEDAGKSVHEGLPDAQDSSFVDLNRSGVPLAEIVSEPDFRSSWEAYDYVQYLRQTLQYVDVCDGNMEEGKLRCDANVSVRLRGAERLGTKVEVKNLNSFRFLQRALDYEIERQINVLETGGKITQETRLWSEGKNKTYPMRSKEDAHDYRYFPEPDLPPIYVRPEWVEQVRASLPELPGARKDRLIQAYGLTFEDAATLTATQELAQYFEAVVEQNVEARTAANWILSELLFLLKGSDRTISACSVTPAQLGEMLHLISDGTISGKIAKDVLVGMFQSGRGAREIVQERGLVQISDASLIEPIIRRVIESNPQKLSEYRAGRERLFGFFVGQVMKESDGKANPALVNELLKKLLPG